MPATASTAPPRVFLDLREAGETCSKHRFARLMREANLRALHGYRTRRSAVGKPSLLIPNLLQRRFTASRPNQAWVTDITYIRTFYNRTRRHSHLGGLSPEQFEATHKTRRQRLH